MERHSLEYAVLEMNKELALKWLIINNFVPPEELERIKQRAIYDENEHKWTMISAKATTTTGSISSSSSSTSALNNDAHQQHPPIGEENGDGENAGTMQMEMERLNLLSPQQSSTNNQKHQMADSGLGRSVGMGESANNHHCIYFKQ